LKEIIEDVVVHTDKLGLPDMLIKISLLRRATIDGNMLDLEPLKLYFRYDDNTYAVTGKTASDVEDDPYIQIWWIDEELSKMLRGL
jgi:hypothetical protein